MRPDEVIARARGMVIDAICGVEDHGRPLEDIFPANVLGAVADAALSTIESALKDAGLAVVEVEKLKQFTAQKLTTEMTEEEIELGDFEGAYDTLVSEARAMLRASQEG